MIHVSPPQWQWHWLQSKKGSVMFPTWLFLFPTLQRICFHGIGHILVQMVGKIIIELDNKSPDLSGESPALAVNIAHDQSRDRRLSEKRERFSLESNLQDSHTPQPKGHI